MPYSIYYKGVNPSVRHRRASQVSTHQRNDDLAIGMCLEVVWCLQGLANQPMVVDLAVDGKNNGVIGVGQGLSAALDTDDAETFVA